MTTSTQPYSSSSSTISMASQLWPKLTHAAVVWSLCNS